MSPYCAFPGARCPKLATRSVVVPGVGPRLLCEPHFRTLASMGLEMRRIVELRPTSPSAA